jgi:hypothetical protein
MKLTEKQIIARIRAHGRGFVFSTKLFSALTDDSASVRTALSRLVQKQSIRRLAHGLYDLLYYLLSEFNNLTIRTCSGVTYVLLMFF